MEDLGQALAGPDPGCMMGGGNPAIIPEMAAHWRRRLGELLRDPAAADRLLGYYEPPRGSPRFVQALVDGLNQAFGWDLRPGNVAVTNGGQTAFFFLLNMFSGRHPDGSSRSILLPVAPEYIGYADQGLLPGVLKACRPRLELMEGHRFKYHVDFDALTAVDDIGAVCASRPTNPTGNVLTDSEVERLWSFARGRNVPLILDNAYGAPFPNIIFSQARPLWGDGLILTMSLSKIGLPGTRTGIVIGPEYVTSAISSMNAVVGLANGNLGQALAAPMLESGELLRLCREVVQPFYARKAAQAMEWVREFFDDGLPYFIHRSEGAIFLWFWFKDLPITTRELYSRLKRRGVIVVPGSYFFYGLETAWAHGQECIRVTYSQPDDIVREGLRILAEEVSIAYRE